MPAEWQPHEGTWLQWPHNKLYPDYELRMESLWLRMVEALGDHENVHLIVADEVQQDHIALQLQYHRINSSHVDYYIIPTDDFWVRDNGPIFVHDPAGEVVITDWTFNGWGGRFEHDLDNLVPGLISAKTGRKAVDAPLILEGGAVEVDGQGVFMATRTSILDENRNPGLSQDQVEQILGEYLGVNRFIWLSGASRGLCEQWGDTTDAHIDITARFTPQGAILYNWSDDPAEPRYHMFARHKHELEVQISRLGLDYALVPLPEPLAGVYQVSTGLDWRDSLYSDAAYSNYYVANEVVLAPVFGNKRDHDALAILREHFPKRTVIGLDCVSLTEHGGAIHCVTQQQPVSLLKTCNEE